MFHRLGLINRNQKGLTLMELLIALAITGIIVSTVTMVIFQVFDGEARSSNHIDAISRAQDAGRYISQDAGMAQTVERTEDDDGFPLTLTWTKWETNDKYWIVYRIVDNSLQRDEYINREPDGDPDGTLVFEHIISKDGEELKTFLNPPDDDDDYTLSFTITAIVGIGSQQVSETRVYEAIPRPGI
jgi:prepilin-type N-terminal cleavage/methylation domain-containing protein